MQWNTINYHGASDVARPPRPCGKCEGVLATLSSLSFGFIDCIIDRMIELDISQSELARRMKVSSPYVSKLLNRDVNLSFATASKFATALGLEFHPLFQLNKTAIPH